MSFVIAAPAARGQAVASAAPAPPAVPAAKAVMVAMRS